MSAAWRRLPPPAAHAWLGFGAGLCGVRVRAAGRGNPLTGVAPVRAICGQFAVWCWVGRGWKADNAGMIDVAAPAQLFGLAQKVVVISGASSGLGARWAPVVAAAGGTVVLSARREPELAQVAAAIPGSLAVPADLTLAQDRQRLVETTLRRFGRIDVLVNSAAAAASAPARDMSLDEFRELIDTDLTSLFALTQL